jgi:hypothetical protein
LLAGVAVAVVAVDRSTTQARADFGHLAVVAAAVVLVVLVALLVAVEQAALVLAVQVHQVPLARRQPMATAALAALVVELLAVVVVLVALMELTEAVVGLAHQVAVGVLVEAAEPLVVQ